MLVKTRCIDVVAQAVQARSALLANCRPLCWCISSGHT